MKYRIRAALLILLAAAIVVICGFLPGIVSGYQDRSIVDSLYRRNIRDLSLTVMNPSPFAKLYLSSSKMSILAVPENRATHSREEIAALALDFFSRCQMAGLIGEGFSVSDYECDFRIHAAESYNYFWHVTMYCRTDVYGNDTGEIPFFYLTLTLDDETGKVYALYYTETTDMDSGRPIKDNNEVVSLLIELYEAELAFREFGYIDPEQITGYYKDTYCDMVFPLTDYAFLGDAVEIPQPQSQMQQVFIEIYASDHSYYIAVTPGTIYG